MSEDRGQAILAEIKSTTPDMTEAEEEAILRMARSIHGVVVFRCICVNDRCFDLEDRHEIAPTYLA